MNQKLPCYPLICFASLALMTLAGCKPSTPTPAPAVVAEPVPERSSNLPDAPVAIPAVTPPATPAYREFKDFVVGCDNTASCTAVGAPKEVQNGLFLSLQRDAGPAGRLLLQVANSGDDGLKASDLTVDTQSSPISQLAWKDDGQGSLTLEDPALVAQFLAAVKDAGKINKGSDKDTYVSLAGLDASVLFIDETQGRLNNVTALVNPGIQPVDTVPPAAAAPALAAAYAPAPAALSTDQSAKLISAVRKQAKPDLKKADCDYRPGPDSLGNADAATALTATDALVFVTCNGGPYQSEVLVYRAPLAGTPATRLSLAPLPFKLGDADAVDFDTLVGADYDPATATLTYFNKGRGLGDCGDMATWRFDGKDFLLASYRSLDRCSGAISDYWPVYWRTAG